MQQIRTTRSGEPDRLRMALDEAPVRKPALWFWLLATAFGLLGFAAVYARHDITAALTPKPGAPQLLAAAQVQVIDGDTIRLEGQKPDIQLLGFSAPETEGARCDVERERGYATMRRLRAIVTSTALTFQPAPCACPPGTEGTEACNAGRRCGTLRANGWDVGERLIAEGHATRLSCTPTGCSLPPRPWCDTPG